MLYNVIGEYEVDKLTGLISDQLIRLTGLTPSVQYTEPLRIVVFEDYATGNVYRFLTNNLTIDTLIVAELYRERWSVELLVPWIKKLTNWSICEISLAELDEINNINSSSLLAMHRSLDKLNPKAKFVFIDGRSEMPNCPTPQAALIKGDSRIPAIAAASIIAKVYRDHLLDEAHNQWPQYQFKENKGYGTAAHMQALHKFGPCPYHRRSFAPIKQLLESSQALPEQAVLF